MSIDYNEYRSIALNNYEVGYQNDTQPQTFVRYAIYFHISFYLSMVFEFMPL